MKNYIEITNDLLKRRDQYLVEQKKKRRTLVRISASLGCCCLVAMLGFGLWRGVMFHATMPITLEASSGSGETNLPDNDNSSKDNNTIVPLPDSPVIWGDDHSEDSAIIEWNGKRVGQSLLYAFENHSDDCIFAIIARPYIDNNFLYSGKTLAEYSDEAENERLFPEKLAALLKVGDSLKYGETLYLTGTPDGEKWAKELYDETIAYYGTELLEKYIVDGIFLKEKVESDIANYHEDKSQKAYEAACDAYLKQVFETVSKQLNEQNIHSERQFNTNYLIIYATEDEFASLSINHMSNWYFGLATQSTDDEDPQDLG